MRSALIYVVLFAAMVGSVLAVSAAGGALFDFEAGTNRAIVFGFPFVLFFGHLVGVATQQLGIARIGPQLSPKRSVMVGLLGLLVGVAAAAIALLAFGADIDDSDGWLLLAVAAVGGIHGAAQLAARATTEW